MPWLGVYSGFYVMLFIETIACVFHPFAVLTLASFLLGTCAYIDGMVKDLKGQMIQLERETTKLSEARLEKQIGGVVWKLLNEIRFHEEIIEYEPILSFFSGDFGIFPFLDDGQVPFATNNCVFRSIGPN